MRPASCYVYGVPYSVENSGSIVTVERIDRGWPAVISCSYCGALFVRSILLFGDAFLFSVNRLDSFNIYNNLRKIQCRLFIVLQR